MLKKYQRHVFICQKCQYSSENGKISLTEWNQELRVNLKKMASEKYSKEELRINGSSCLGQCQLGIAAVCYPEGKWFIELKRGDEKVIFDYLENSHQES